MKTCSKCAITCSFRYNNYRVFVTIRKRVEKKASMVLEWFLNLHLNTGVYKRFIPSRIWRVVTVAFSSGSIDAHAIRAVSLRCTSQFLQNRYRFFTAINLLSFLIHGCISVTILSIGNARKITIWTFLHAYDTRQESVNRVQEPVAIPLFEVNMVSLLGASEMISAVISLLKETVLQEMYYMHLNMRMCPLRWIEYGVTAPIIFFILCCICGIVLFEHLLLQVVLMHVTMYFGYIAERMTRPHIDFPHHRWTLSFKGRVWAHAMGYVPCLTAWTIALATLHIRGAYVRRVSFHVSAMVWTEFVMFMGFAFVQLAFMKLPPHYYPHTEYMYGACSLGAKTLIFGYLWSDILMYAE